MTQVNRAPLSRATKIQRISLGQRGIRDSGGRLHWVTGYDLRARGLPSYVQYTLSFLTLLYYFYVSRLGHIYHSAILMASKSALLFDRYDRGRAGNATPSAQW